MVLAADATKGWYIPNDASECTTLLSGTGIPNPAYLYPLQDASNPAVDVIGGKNLSNAASTVAFFQTSSGWSRKAVRLADGAVARLINNTFANVNAQDYTVLVISRTTTGAPIALTNRTLFHFGDTFNGDFSVEHAVVGGNQRIMLGNGTTRVTGSFNPVGIDQKHWLRIGDTADTIHLDTSQEALNDDGAANAGAGTEFGIGGNNANTWLAPGADFYWIGIWTSRLSDANIATINSRIENGVGLSGDAAITLGSLTAAGTGTYNLVVPGRGPDGAALFMLDIEDGGEVTYSFSTDVMRALDGKETRTALIGCPRETYSFGAILDDAQVGAFMAQVMRYGANAEPILIALPYEALPVVSITGGVTINVPSTSLCDWVYAGSRIVVLSSNGVTHARGVIQSFTSTTIVVNTTISITGPGTLVMPTMACYIDAQQSVERYAMNLSKVSIRARAILFGNATSDFTPAGTPVTTYTDPESAEVFPVWDRRIVVSGTALHAQLMGNEIVDRGGVLMNIPMLSEADELRDVNFTIHSNLDRQWFKLFLKATMGRQKPFLLPTWKPDLVPLSDASTGTVLVEGPPGAMDYAATWFTGRHRWVQIVKTDGTVHYRKVQDAADNLDGTQDILLNASLAGAIATISVVELCRWEQDEFPITWSNGIGEIQIKAHAVQR